MKPFMTKLTNYYISLGLVGHIKKLNRCLPSADFRYCIIITSAMEKQTPNSEVREGRKGGEGFRAHGGWTQA